MSDHQRWVDAAGAYVLGAMPERERERFEEHLAECDVCREEVEELRPAAEALPIASAQLAPPAALKDRIMAEVEREAALLAEAGPAADRPPRRRRRWSPVSGWRLAPVAATVLAVGVLAGFVIAGLGGGAQTYEGAVNAAVLPGATAELRIEGDEATLVAERLPEPEGDDVYQVWIMRRGARAPEPSVLFLPRNGSATAAVPDAGDDAEAVLVTREPRPGSDTPSEDPVVTIPMA